MRTISIINQKGGCGKTTTAINLAASLAVQKRRVLVVDLDSQGHASLGLNLKPEEVARGMTEVLTQGTYLDDVIYESISPNLDLAPANITLSAVEQLLADAAHKEKKLLTAIQRMRKTYDYVIIDSPPNLGILTFNALRASDLAIVPVDMGYFSLHGLQKLKEITEVLGRHTGHFVKLRALGIMVNVRNKFAQEVLEELKKNFDGHLFGTLIRNSVRLREATKHGVPALEYAPNSAGAQDYVALAQEVIAMEAVASPPGPTIETLLPTVPGVSGESNINHGFAKEV